MELISRRYSAKNKSPFLSRYDRRFGDEKKAEVDGVGYTPHGGALELMRSRDRAILIEGPTGTGKSRAVLEKLYLQASKYAGLRILICRKSRESMSESVLVTWEQKVVPVGSSLLLGVSGQQLLRTKRHSYKFPNGSEVIIGGLNKPSRIMSTDFDVIALFEGTEANESDIDALITRLRNNRMPYQQLIVDCNPAQPAHHLNQRALRGDMKRILSRHADNPSLTQEYLDGLDKLRGARKLRFKDGIWAAQEGLVYDEWDNTIHVLDAVEVVQKLGGLLGRDGEWLPGRNFRIICSIDFGYTNPACVQWWAIAPSGVMILYRELYVLGYTPGALGKAILRWSRPEEFIEATLRDHDAAGGADLAELGIPTIPAYKSFADGYGRVLDWLGERVGGLPKIVALRDALVFRDPELVKGGLPCGLVEEMQYYAWPIAADGKPKKKEMPIDAYNHACDTMRYAVAYASGLGVNRNAGISW